MKYSGFQSLIVLAVLASMATATGFSQEEEVTPEQPQQEGKTIDELPDKLQRYHRLVSPTQEVYQITIDGLIHRNFVHRRNYRTPKPLLAILCDPEIAQELNISTAKREKLEKQIDDLDAACERAKKLYDEWDSESADDLERDTLKALEPPVKEAIGAIRDSLAEAESVRFRQILLQLEIGRRGMLWFIESKLGDEIGLTLREKKSLKKLYVDEVRGALKKIQTHKEDAIGELFAVVPESDRKKMIAKLGDESNLYRTPLKLMALQVDHETVESFRKYQGESEWPKYAGISLPFSFKVNAGGKIVFSPPVRGEEDVESDIPGMLLLYCLFDGELVLTEEQSGAVRSLHREGNRMHESQLEEMNAWTEATGHDATPEMRERNIREIEKFRNELVSTIEGILLPHQLAVMEEFAARSRFSLHGPVACF